MLHTMSHRVSRFVPVCYKVRGLSLRHGRDMEPPVRLLFAVSSPPPKAANDTPFPPAAEPPPRSPPDPSLTRHLGPKRYFRDFPIHPDDLEGGASAPGAHPLKDAKLIEQLNVHLRAYLKAQKAEGNTIRQPAACEEVLRAARKDLDYKGLTTWRAMEQVVRPTWKAMESDGE